MTSYCSCDVPNDDSGQSGLTLQLFPVVTSNLIGQNNPLNQWNWFIRLGAEGQIEGLFITSIPVFISPLKQKQGVFLTNTQNAEILLIVDKSQFEPF